MTDTVTTILSVGAIFVQALIALGVLCALAALVSRGARRSLADLADTAAGPALWIAFALALIAMAGSLFFSEHASYIPCRLCWYQRIAMYPLVVIFLGAAIRRDVRGAVFYGAPLALAGTIVAAYHIYIEYHPESETPGCKIGAPCTTKWIDEYGYITIPVLAITAFVAILGLLALAWRARARRDVEAPAA
jgi:disulfide bond formation protein DsbB